MKFNEFLLPLTSENYEILHDVVYLQDNFELQKAKNVPEFLNANYIGFVDWPIKDTDPNWAKSSWSY